MHAWIRRLIAILEIGGGFMGFVLMLLSRQWNINKPVYDWILFIFFIFVFLFGIVSGLPLLEKPQLGSALSAAYQALQIPVISSPLLTYELFSGLQLGFGWSKGRYVFLYGFGARSILVFWKRTAPWLIGVNTLALFFFIYLLIQFLPNIKSTSASGETINHANNVQPVENRRKKSARRGARLSGARRSTEARKQKPVHSLHDAFRQMPSGKVR